MAYSARLKIRTGTRAVVTANSSKAPNFRYLASFHASGTFGERVRKWKLEQDLRQIDLAEMVGANEMTVVRWELDRGLPTEDKMSKLEEIIGESLETK